MIGKYVTQSYNARIDFIKSIDAKNHSKHANLFFIY